MQTKLFESRPIRALTWKEPFGTLMLHGKIETRKWATSFRGDVLISCGKTPYNDWQLLEICGLDQLERMTKIIQPGSKMINCGYAVAVGTLVNCRMMTRADEDDCFVQYRQGLWCHIYDNIRPIAPMPYKGQQGWKKLPESIWDTLEFISELVQ